MFHKHILFMLNTIDSTKKSFLAWGITSKTVWNIGSWNMLDILKEKL